MKTNTREKLFIAHLIRNNIKPDPEIIRNYIDIINDFSQLFTGRYILSDIKPYINADFIKSSHLYIDVPLSVMFTKNEVNIINFVIKNFDDIISMYRKDIEKVKKLLNKLSKN